MTSKLILNSHKLNIAMANECLNPYALCEKVGISYSTFQRIAKEEPIKTATVGKVAKGLNCKVEDLI